MVGIESEITNGCNYMTITELKQYVKRSKFNPTKKELLEINKPEKSEKLNDLIVRWIKLNLRDTYNCASREKSVANSYRLKHIFSDSMQHLLPHSEYGDFYITNGNFKYAMLEAGLKPYFDDGINSFYILHKLSSGIPNNYYTITGRNPV